jgi:hypothetical protein
VDLFNNYDRIGGVIVSVLASIVVDRRFEPQSGQPNDYHALLEFYIANSLKQQPADRHGGTLEHIILIPSQPVVVVSP